jgi:hypothetical protein
VIDSGLQRNGTVAATVEGQKKRSKEEKTEFENGENCKMVKKW